MSDEMSDGEMFRAWRKDKQAGREKNRNDSAQMLTDAGIAFEIKNGGAHLIVSGKRGIIDFWPGTGKYIARGAIACRGRGVRNVIALAS